MTTIISTTPTLTTCPRWCTNPAHRLPDEPTPDELDLAASEPHEGPVSGSSRSSDVEVLLVGQADGPTSVSVSVAGNEALRLPPGEAVYRLAAMSDALRVASEDVAPVLAGAPASSPTRSGSTYAARELVEAAERLAQAARRVLDAVENKHGRAK